jgi:alpha-galactosidase/6-phospho-beta-glucosidase family protein
MGKKIYRSERNFFNKLFSTKKFGGIKVFSKISGETYWQSGRIKLSILDGKKILCDVESSQMSISDFEKNLANFQKDEFFKNADLSKLKVHLYGRIERDLNSEEIEAIKKCDKYDEEQKKIRAAEAKKRKADRAKEKREYEKAQKVQSESRNVANALEILKEHGLNVVVVRENGIL